MHPVTNTEIGVFFISSVLLNIFDIYLIIFLSQSHKHHPPVPILFSTVRILFPVLSIVLSGKTARNQLCYEWRHFVICFSMNLFDTIIIQDTTKSERKKPRGFRGFQFKLLPFPCMPLLERKNKQGFGLHKHYLLLQR